MASDVDLANDALTLLGAGRIIDFDQDTTAAKALKQVYQTAVDSVLQAYPWSEALVRTELAQLVGAPEYGYTYQYQIPTDPVCLRILEVYNPNTHSERDTDWMKVGDKLLSDLESVKITYISSIPASKINPLLRQAIAAYLAYSLAYTLLQSNTVQTQMFQIYKERLQEARIVNNLETVGNRIHRSQLSDVRH